MAYKLITMYELITIYISLFMVEDNEVSKVCIRYMRWGSRDYLKLARMLSVLGRIYRLGHISEAEYNEVKKRLLKEYNIF